MKLGGLHRLAEQTWRSTVPRLTVLPWLILGACGGISVDLQAATTLYEEARYERVQQWVAALEHERSAMSDSQRLRFRYLAGMAAYRLGQRTAAHHHLALAAVLLRRWPRGLSERDGALLARVFTELSPASSVLNP